MSPIGTAAPSKGDNVTMTDTTSTTRIYRVGETVNDGDYALHSPYEEWCNTSIPGGWSCSIRSGHTGPQHVAVGGHTVQAVSERDQSGDPIVGTFEPGDMVQALPGLRVATVLGVERDTDSVVRAWLVGQRDGDDTWRLIKSPVDALSPHTGGEIGPTLADIGQALRTKAATMDADVEANRNARRAAERERDATNEEMENLKREVVRVAMENARVHNWCGVVTRALRDMDLGEYLTNRYRVPVTITATRTVQVQVEAESAEAARRMVDEMGESELDDAFEAHDGSSLYSRVLSDWSYESHDSSTDVTNLDD